MYGWRDVGVAPRAPRRMRGGAVWGMQLLEGNAQCQVLDVLSKVFVAGEFEFEADAA